MTFIPKRLISSKKKKKVKKGLPEQGQRLDWALHGQLMMQGLQGEVDPFHLPAQDYSQGKRMGGREDTAAATAPAKPGAHSEAATDVRGGCSVRGPQREATHRGGGKGSLYQGPEVIHSRVPLARPGKSQAVLSNHGDGPWAPL